jgi:arsenite oxidase small subunit
MGEVNNKDLTQKDNITRRGLLKTAGKAGAAALVVGGLASKASASVGGSYPQVRIANIKNLKEGEPVNFDYPLIGRKNILVDCGCVVESGVGTNKSVVAYSMFCTHLGCGVDYKKDTATLVCECHQTEYDPKHSGRVIQGPAPTNLPMVSLEIDDKGDIYATGIAGLIYGMRNNLLDGKEVE